MNKKSTRYHRFNEGTPTINFEWDEPVEKPQSPAEQVLLTSDNELGTGLAFISLGSGSSGNCSYIGTTQSGVLIDAGVDPQNVFDELRRNGISRDAVKGVVLTHDHQDHVRYVYKIVRDYNKQARIYCTMRLMNGMLRRHNISRRVKDYQVPIWLETPFKLCGMEFTAFETSHDGTDNMGFSIQMGNQNYTALLPDQKSAEEFIEFVQAYKPGSGPENDPCPEGQYRHSHSVAQPLHQRRCAHHLLCGHPRH